MADSITCTNEACTEYGIEKRPLGGAIDDTVPCFCGVCGTQLLGPSIGSPDAPE